MVDTETVSGLVWEQVGERESPAGFLKVGSRTYRYPNGNVAEWDILRGGNTVALVALTDENQVVMVWQYRPGPAKVLLELPGGIAEPHEAVGVAAARELLEETGYEAGSVEVVASTYLAAYATHVRHAVLARGCRRIREPQPGADEFVAPVLVPLADFVRHVLGGQLTDMDMALAGLVAAGVLRSKHTTFRDMTASDARNAEHVVGCSGDAGLSESLTPAPLRPELREPEHPVPGMSPPIDATRPSPAPSSGSKPSGRGDPEPLAQ